MRNALYCSCLSALWVLGAAALTQADNSGIRPGFVKDLMRPQAQAGQESGASGFATERSPQGGGAVADQQVDGFIELSPDQTEQGAELVQPASRPQEVPRKAGILIERLSGIIDLSDPANAEKVTSEFVRTITQYDLIPGMVHLLFKVGGPKINAEKVLAPLAAVGAEISFSNRIPEEYSVTHAPTWIVVTRYGRVVLEGFPSITRFLNPQGEFVDLEKSERLKFAKSGP